LVRWAESCQVGAEWLIPEGWCKKAKGLQRRADNVARYTSRDRRIRLVEDYLRCVAWTDEEQPAPSQRSRRRNKETQRIQTMWSKESGWCSWDERNQEYFPNPLLNGTPS